MSKKTDPQLTELWRHGVPMSKAWLSYATPDLKSAWVAAQKPSAMALFEEAAEKAAKSDAEPSSRFLTAMAPAQKLLAERSTLQSKLRANILRYIEQGHLHGFGYELPRKLENEPVAIPKEAWAGKCNWDKGSLSYRGLEFVDVRLTTNRIRNEILARGSVDTTPPNAVGRPSVKAEILAAIHALHEAGEIDPTKSQKSHFPKALRWLELNRPDMYPAPKTISYETFRKYFAPFFRDLKENRKQ